MTVEREWRARAVADEVGRLRNAVSAAAEAAGVHGMLLHDLRLAVSEALTNAVVHAYRGVAVGEVVVRLRAAAREVEVLVEDDGVGLSPRADSPGVGLGLPLITSVTSASSVSLRPDGGTQVSMTFPIV